jgi:signal transduction histidine kinase
MVSAVAMTLGAIHLVVWAKSRQGVSLAFSVAALSVALIAMGELAIMHTAEPIRFGRLIQWMHVPVFTLFCGFVLFVRLHLGGSWRFALFIIALRFVSLVINFAFPPNLNYREIISIRSIEFLGRSVYVVGESVGNPLLPVGELSILLTLFFTIGAMRTCWRRNGTGDRRKAVLIGGSYVFYVAVMLVFAMSLHRGVIQMPYLLSVMFLFIIVIMGYELSRDVIEAVRLSEQLKDNLAGMKLAAQSAQLTTWNWDIKRDVIAVDDFGRRLYGVPDDAPATFSRFIETLHPGDRASVQSEVETAIRERRDFKADYRVLHSDGSVRWINAIGTLLFNGGKGDAVRMIGVSMDITDRKRTEEAMNNQREELAHISRVTTLGELSGALAHELNQPLAIMLSNAQAAQRLLARDPPDLPEVRDILSDIVREDRRAGEVIQRMRDLLRRGETKLAPQDMNRLVSDVLTLLHSDLLDRGVAIERDLSPDLPEVLGDRVQLQQVILNLLVNAGDAMRHLPVGARTVNISSGMHQGRVCVTVRDHGNGIDGNIEQVFQPYFTTKKEGLGMGLSICRSIMQAHHGWLWAENHPMGGAVFHMELPAQAGGGNA